MPDLHEFARAASVADCVPAADVYETTTDEFAVELELPGFEQKDLAIEVTDHTLVVPGSGLSSGEDEPDSQFRLANASIRFSRAASSALGLATRST